VSGNEAEAPGPSRKRGVAAGVVQALPRTTTGSAGGASCFSVKEQSWRTTRLARSLLSRTNGSSRCNPTPAEAVLDLRRRWQKVIEKDLSREIEVLTGRTVVGFMSDNHIDPDLAVEVFLLAPLTGATEARPS
jgi:hypothetical protein